jgi:SAM-dependent methyltransferase
MKLDPHVYGDQFGFQRLYSHGRILNVGCNTDGGGLGNMGAVNLDLATIDNLGQAMPVHVIADARALPFRNCFDTVVLGEILEHMEAPDAIAALTQGALALRPGGRLVVTMPHDVRREDGTLEIPEQEFYTEGVYAYHYRCIGWEELVSWVAAAGCQIDLRADIVYLWGERGSGCVLTRLQDKN